MKQLKYGMPFILLLSSLIYANSSSVQAHDARTEWTSGCTTPASNSVLGSGNVETSTLPEYGTSNKHGTKYYHTTNHSKDTSTWVPEDKKTKTPGYWDVDHSEDYDNHVSGAVTDTCTASKKSSTASTDRGTVTHVVEYTDDTVNDTSQNHYTYFVKKVEMTIKAYSREDEEMPSPTCTKTFGNGATKDCSKDVSVTKDEDTTTIRKTCYEYKENGYSDEACTTRVYVESVVLKGPKTTYTGEKFGYLCLATYYDNTTKDVSAEDQVWSSTPYDYMGDNYIGYLDNRYVRHEAGKSNVFYPADPNDRSYTIKCRWYPNAATQHSNSWISDKSQEQSDSLTIEHIGIEKLTIDVSGQFLKPNTNGAAPNQYEQVDNLVPNAKNLWDKYDFITGHWYNFRAMVEYTDGRERDVTNAKEIYWDNTPWYLHYPKHSKANSLDSGMSESGTEHRIPRDGYNTISVKYFHDNVPYGTPSSGVTQKTAELWSHQITEVKITGNTITTPPKITATPGEVIQYKAWVTWSDEKTNPFKRGASEDWTSEVLWEGDSRIGDGVYEFKMSGIDQKASVYARIVDTNRLYGSLTNWDDHYDKIEVTITGCTGKEHIAWKCDTPANYWATNPTIGFGLVPTDNAYPQANFLPPPDKMGFSAWNQETNPYGALYEFPVSGFSSGTSGKNDGQQE